MQEMLNLGSVFKQKAEKALPLMVVGYMPVDPDTGEIYDYLTVMYPQGWLSNSSLLMINHNQIKEILSDGYYDEKTKELVDSMSQLVEKAQ